MRSEKVVAPKFQWAFLLPKYWPTWLGIMVLYTLSWLPYFVLRWFGRGVGWLLSKLAKQRVKIAQRNIQLCFPEKSAEQQEALVKANLARAGMALFETIMGWWWPDWRVRRVGEVEGFEHVEAVLKQGKGVFGLALHNMNLELGCRVIGQKHPSIAFYRKHNNPLLDYMQYHGRNRSNKYMIHKRNSKALIDALNSHELCLYLPDQDYGRRGSLFVPFFAVEEAATTTATLMFARKADCVPLLITSQESAKGCKIKVYPPLDGFAEQEDEAALHRMNKEIEKIVAEQPESYLWMHKRFKTRPSKDAASLYKGI